MRLRTTAAIALVLLAGCTTTTTISRGPTGATPDPRPSAAAEEADATRRAEARLALAAAYYSRGQVEVALEEVRRALAADPNHGPAYNLRGLVYASLGDDRLAEESFRRALQLNARDADAMNNFGWFLCQRKRYAESYAMFDQALAVPTYRDVPRTLLAKGVCQAFDKQYGEAERTLSRAQQMDPGNPATATNLAEVLYRLGQYERARDTIRRVNAMPGIANAQTLWLAARIERRLGNQAAVADLGQRLRSQFPDAPETDAFERGRFVD